MIGAVQLRSSFATLQLLTSVEECIQIAGGKGVESGLELDLSTPARLLSGPELDLSTPARPARGPELELSTPATPARGL